MIELKCNIDIPKVEGLKDQELTVGREFIFVCDGDYTKDLQQDKLEFIKTPEMKYQIKLLGFEFRSPTQADIKVTSYTPGMVRLPQLQLTDGVQVLNLGDQSFSVVSVIQAPAAGQAPPTEGGAGQSAAAQQPQPFPAMGPIDILIPSLYWTIFGVIVGGLVLSVGFKIVQFILRKNTLERLKAFDSAQTPEQQFHANFRKLQRTNPVFFDAEVSSEDAQSVVSETLKYFKTYLTRRYQIPALELSDRLLLKDLKKYHPKAYGEFRSDLEKILKEYSLALKDQNKLTKIDAQNLAHNSRKLVEKLERFS